MKPSSNSPTVPNSGGDDQSEDGAYESPGDGEGANDDDDEESKDNEISMEETKAYEEFK